MGVDEIQLLRQGHLVTVMAKLVYSLTLSSKVSRAGRQGSATWSDSAVRIFSRLIVNEYCACKHDEQTKLPKDDQIIINFGIPELRYSQNFSGLSDTLTNAQTHNTIIVGIIFMSYLVVQTLNCAQYHRGRSSSSTEAPRALNATIPVSAIKRFHCKLFIKQTSNIQWKSPNQWADNSSIYDT